MTPNPFTPTAVSSITCRRKQDMLKNMAELQKNVARGKVHKGLAR